MNDEYHCKAHNVQKIIEDYLRENGFDGLFCTTCECGCKLEDLFPCDEVSFWCEPGYILEPTEDHPQYDETDWIIGPKRGK